MRTSASIARRIAKLEKQILRAPLVIVLRHFTAEPVAITGRGRRWNRAEGESLEALRARARSDVLAGKSLPPVIVLVEVSA